MTNFDARSQLRTEIMDGRGGRQIRLDDPSGLFQPHK